MKKGVKYILLTFMFMCLSLCISMKVSAAESENLWSILQGYTVVETNESSKYEFYPEYDSDEVSSHSKTSNYNFSYDYSLRASVPLIDGSNSVYAFYGAYNEITVDYVNLKGIPGIDDVFKVYKYNFTSREFEAVHAPGMDKSGNYTLTKGTVANLYKLEVTGLGAGTRTAYVIIDDNITSGNFENLEFNQEEAKITASIRFKAPFDYNKISRDVKVYIGNTNISNRIINQSVELVDATGEYRLTVVLNASGLTAVDKELKVSINEFSTIKEKVSYDFVKPSITEGKFYDSRLILEGFEAINDYKTPSEWAYKFTVTDEGEISSVTSNFESVTCAYEEGVAICVGNASIVVEGQSAQVEFIVKDGAGNIATISKQLAFSYNNITNEKLENTLQIENDTISLLDTTDIIKLCIFYGETLDEVYECGDASGLTSSYYYQGPVTIVAIDSTNNAALLRKEVVFTNGYDVSNSQEVSTITNSVLEDAYNQLIDVIDAAEVKKYVKYGELVEEYDGETVISLDSLELLNTKFQDKTCAFEKCDKTVVAYLEFEIAGVKQNISYNLLVKDNAPNVTTSLSKDDINLEYKKFDINNVDLKGKLYADGYLINLLDEDGNEYSGEVTSAFVNFTNKKGEVVKIDDKPYDYIASATKIGTYLLECKVKINKNLTTNQEYTDNYGKSFFLKVNLNDNTLPTITLLGDSEISIKQHDVYKDSGAKCEDYTECVITINYYLDDTKVDSIDTSVEGTYTIEYVATDEGGNVAKTTRKVVVENINALDTTSIIIIVSVVVLFIIFITAGIIIEKKKSKPTSSREE